MTKRSIFRRHITRADPLSLVTHRTQARFGWVPDLPDQRDQVYSAPPPPAQGLPASVDLRPHCPPVYDQGQLAVARPMRSRARSNSTARNRSCPTSSRRACSSTTTSASWRARSARTPAPRSATGSSRSPRLGRRPRQTGPTTSRSSRRSRRPRPIRTPSSTARSRISGSCRRCAEQGCLASGFGYRVRLYGL